VNVFKWVPTVADTGKHYPIVTVSDGALSDIQTVVVTIVPCTNNKHDRMAANTNAWFDWLEREVTWYPDQDGYLSTSTAAWDAGVVSRRVLVTADHPYMVFRFEHIQGATGTNNMFGFTDDPPNSGSDGTKFDYHNMKRGLYIHSSSGGIKTVYNGVLHDKSSQMLASGTYDLKIEFGSDGITHFTIDDVSNYAAPLSDFTSPVWSDTARWNLASQYHIQINPYNTNSKVYDVWESPTVTSVAKLPMGNLLAQNYPNPFNPITTVSFTLKSTLYVELKIYDVKGRLIRVLLGKTMESGRHDLLWNGKDKNGESVPTGVYFCQLIAGGDTQTRKMVILR
jgi:hypothetical protein